MKKLLKIILVALIAISFAGTASATPVHITQADLLGMTMVYDGAGVGSISAPTGGPGSSVHFTGTFPDYVTQLRSIRIGYEGTSVPTTLADLSTGSTEYELTFNNTNNQTWLIDLFLTTNDGSSDTMYQNGWFSIAVGQVATLSLDLSSVADLDTVTGIGFQLAFNDPTLSSGLYQGDIFHLNVNPVPEPASVFLLLLGFLGLAAVGRKKFF